jgi:TrpR-related protein YerC/YecD
MAKFPRISKLSKKEQMGLILEFCEAVVAIRNIEEAASFIKDLLGEQEIEMLAKRLKVAKLLLSGRTHEEIRDELKVSFGTISRVSLWVKTSGEGYRLIAKRTRKKEKSEVELMVKESLNSYIRARASYYWPYLLWKEVMKGLSQRKKERFQKILAKTHEKKKIYREFTRLLQETYGMKNQ